MPIEFTTGELDRKIRIERATETRDSFNNIVQTWSELATIWSSKDEIMDSERISAQEVGADMSVRFKFRWSSRVQDVNPKDRIIFQGKAYNIVSVKEIGRKDGIEVTGLVREE